MYHSIADDEARCNQYCVTPETLESDLKYLKENGYTAVLTEDLINYVFQGEALPEKPVVITADDGFYNNLYYMLPLLEKYDMKAIISIVGSFTDNVAAQDVHNKIYAYCSWEDVSRLLESERIEIGNHTYNMHSTAVRNGCAIMSGESEEDYHAALLNDLGLMQSLTFENTGYTPIAFTYPYGYICRESKSVIRELGFKAYYTCYEQPNYITHSPDTLYGLNRYNRPSGISTEDFMKRVLKV